jgi:hypothetical protein
VTKAELVRERAPQLLAAGMKYADISHELGCSREYVRQILGSSMIPCVGCGVPARNNADNLCGECREKTRNATARSPRAAYLADLREKGLRECCYCKEVLSIKDDFPAHRDHASDRDYICNECNRKKVRRWADENPEKYRELYTRNNARKAEPWRTKR